MVPEACIIPTTAVRRRSEARVLGAPIDALVPVHYQHAHSIGIIPESIERGADGACACGEARVQNVARHLVPIPTTQGQANHAGPCPCLDHDWHLRSVISATCGRDVTQFPLSHSAVRHLTGAKSQRCSHGDTHMQGHTARMPGERVSFHYVSIRPCALLAIMLSRYLHAADQN